MELAILLDPPFSQSLGQFDLLSPLEDFDHTQHQYSIEQLLGNEQDGLAQLSIGAVCV